MSPHHAERVDADPALLDRIRARAIENGEGCWLWQGSLSTGGYGQISIGGKLYAVHRVAYEAEKGVIPVGLQLDHLCRTRACCNPAHLEAVTPRENTLRGEAGKHFTARAALITHCPRGHAYTPENTDIRRGRRHCRACRTKAGASLIEPLRVSPLTGDDPGERGRDISLGASLAHVMNLSVERINRVVAEVQPTHVVATVSGGRDSAAEVELARDMGIKIDLILHCRTGTGIPETTKHVVDYYGNLGPDFVMADAGDAYEEYVMRKGFFGVGRDAHNFSYRVLKATPMRKAISRAIRKGTRGVRVLLLNGARKAESANRRTHLKETRADPACPGNIWVNLIHDWKADDRDRYLCLRNTPINPVAVQLCRSGECMCGTMQSAAVRAEASAVYPEWAAWLNDLERRAKAKHGWGWGETMPKARDCRQSDLFQPLCIGCAGDERRDAGA